MPGRFNRDISRVVWPRGLEILEFGIWFDQALVSPDTEEGPPLGRKHAFPAGLKLLNLGEVFNQPLGGHVFPTGLKDLSLGWEFNQPLSGSELPDGLEVLHLPSSLQLVSSIRWPSGLKQLGVSCELGVDHLLGGRGVHSARRVELPPNLENFSVGGYFNSPLTTVAWPATLKVLNLGDTFTHPIGDVDSTLLPDGLEELNLGMAFNHSIDNALLPVGLKRLNMMDQCSSFNQGLPGVLWPPGLEELQLGDSFNQPMEGTTFPETLRRLSFGWAFSYSLQGVALPDGLTSLSFKSKYPVAHLRKLDWPRSLRNLHIGSSWFGCQEAFAAEWAAQRR